MECLKDFSKPAPHDTEIQSHAVYIAGGTKQLNGTCICELSAVPGPGFTGGSSTLNIRKQASGAKLDAVNDTEETKCKENLQRDSSLLLQGI